MIPGGQGGGGYQYQLVNIGWPVLSREAKVSKQSRPRARAPTPYKIWRLTPAPTTFLLPWQSPVASHRRRSTSTTSDDRGREPRWPWLRQERRGGCRFGLWLWLRLRFLRGR